jgi:hypothetical protein
VSLPFLLVGNPFSVSSSSVHHLNSGWCGVARATALTLITNYKSTQALLVTIFRRASSAFLVVPCDFVFPYIFLCFVVFLFSSFSCCTSFVFHFSVPSFSFPFPCTCFPTILCSLNPLYCVLFSYSC